MYALAERGQTDALLAWLTAHERETGDADAKHWALVAAAEANQVDTAEALMDAGADPNGSPTQHAYIKPLWKAAKRGHLAMVQRLVARGARVHDTDGAGMTALAYAQRYGRADVVGYLAAFDQSVRQ